MFANRYTALIDACSLVSVLRRNTLLSLAEAEFYRVRWSDKILLETQRAISKILDKKGYQDHSERAEKSVCDMQSAFTEAMVDNYEHLYGSLPDLPDPNDAHVIAAAIKAKADVIVTENIRDFPDQLVSDFGLEIITADAFITDTMTLHMPSAISAIRCMRMRFQNPQITPELLITKYEDSGLMLTAEILSDHVDNL